VVNSGWLAAKEIEQDFSAEDQTGITPSEISEEWRLCQKGKCAYK